MNRKACSKKKNSFIGLLVGLFFILLSATAVQAATNPLAQMPKKSSYVINAAATGKGCDFFTPQYASKVKISVKSYNPGVVTVEGYSFKGQNGKNFVGYETTPVAPGSAKIKVKVTVGSKSYTKTCNYTVYKWENPFKTFKVGTKNLRSNLNEAGSALLPMNSLKGKFTYKLKSGYTMESIFCYAKSGDQYMTARDIKSGKTLPKGTYRILMQIKSKKNNEYYNVAVSTPQQ